MGVAKYSGRLYLRMRRGSRCSDGCVFAKRGGTEEYSAAVSRDEASSSSHGSEPARGRSAALARGSAGAHADPRIVHPARERGSVEREFSEVREDICLLRMQRESITLA